MGSGRRQGGEEEGNKDEEVQKTVGEDNEEA